MERFSLRSETCFARWCRFLLAVFLICFTFVARLIVFLATCSIRFLICCSNWLFVEPPSKLNLNFFKIFIGSLVSKSVLRISRSEENGSHVCRFWDSLRSLFHHNFFFEPFLKVVHDFCREWLCIKYFRSKHACWAFSQFELYNVLFVAMFESGVSDFRPIWASNGEICATPSGVIRISFKISATCVANLNGVLFLSVLRMPNLRLSVFIHLSTTPIDFRPFIYSKLILI